LWNVNLWCPDSAHEVHIVSFPTPWFALLAPLKSQRVKWSNFAHCLSIIRREPAKSTANFFSALV
jgi:hypothetical protein